MGNAQACVDFKSQSTTEIGVGVIVLTVLIYLQKGFNHLTFLLDNAKIHGKKMKANVPKERAEIAQQVTLPDFTFSFGLRRATRHSSMLLNILFTWYGETVYLNDLVL
ncbi:hypothetical protein METHB2_190038 [Candidatus Methylobacter favarea]|uniref:Uncharacterized protein n=1 Tax=Candidatus Methylobacter favarea TaxID=2707345 RepID=A0A8S0WHX8_9GAMM|nr:hypothetical protein [Candidatus Methylobacter favarea]CAA9890151.1 hypothetical protein METHB2_190038 [Candidatus Methylobacter favarea]